MKFEKATEGYKCDQVDSYIKRLDDEFQGIMKNQACRFGLLRENVAALGNELEERLTKIREYANAASEQRYLKGDCEMILANLIMQVLEETDKTLGAQSTVQKVEDFFEVLAANRELKLDEALEGFDFFDNNPYKAKCEKKLAKLERKRNRGSRK